ncbi:hypothetical protein ABG79_00652 [Caloramator mitchellensis]|uniref:Uncharacterized protein n=1 Tax=Caloramator mitchellensis TaxID=908809 RepID=A0A0R3K310_CALMK|nr:hypothetical protein [Caloramator mitchellensis]KRQ87314.1 hypothetical protein ABG79_00652 [Caloramator mitchellensis]
MLKKIAYFVLTVFVFTLSLSTNAFAKSTTKITESALKVGIVKNYSSSTLTVLENGKAVSYKVTSQTKVYSLGNTVDFSETIKKGLKVKFKLALKGNVPQYISYLDIPTPGIEGRGTLGLEVNDIRQNETDDPVAPTVAAPKLDSRTNLVSGALANVKELQAVDETSFIYVNNKRLGLGQIEVLQDTIKLTVNGKDIKVIASDKEFDKTAPDDEAKLVKEKNNYYIDFEKDFTDKDLTDEEVNNLIKISYQKKMYQIDAVEFNAFPISEDCYVELNGKETTLQKAIYRGTYAYVRTNLDGEIIYIDAFYNDVPARIVEVNNAKKTIKVAIYKYGKIAFEDTLVVSDAAAIKNKNGEFIRLIDLVPSDKIIFTVDPLEGYKVISIERTDW